MLIGLVPTGGWVKPPVFLGGPDRGTPATELRRASDVDPSGGCCSNCCQEEADMKAMKSRLSPGATLALAGAALVAVVGGLALARSPRIRALPASVAIPIHKLRRAKRAREITRALLSRLNSVRVA